MYVVRPMTFEPIDFKFISNSDSIVHTVKIIFLKYFNQYILSLEYHGVRGDMQGGRGSLEASLLFLRI